MRVYKYRQPGRKNWYIKWFGPNGKELGRQTTGTPRAAQAERIRAAKELELARVREIEMNGFDAFADRYESEVIGGTSENNRKKYRCAINKLKQVCGPELVEDVDSRAIAKLVRSMRSERLSESTIHNYLTYLEAALKWASHPTIGMVDTMPLIKKPSLTEEKAKGRPINLEEFERLKMKVEAVVGQEATDSFVRLLDGLWLSGLRLGESMNLYWQRSRDRQIVVRESSSGIKLEIPGRAQKRRRFLDYVPHEDFQQFLSQTPKPCRKGQVFTPLNRKGRVFTRVDTVSKRISRMGELAGIVVEYDEDGPSKFASQKDLRASFAQRQVDAGVDPYRLQRLMRHRSIMTTLKYYATADPADYELSPRRRKASNETLHANR